MKRLSIKEIKKRQYSFVIGCFIAIVICYKLAFSNTLSLFNEYKLAINSNQNIFIQDSTVVNKELVKLNQLFINIKADTLIVHENLLDKVTEFSNANNCKIVNFPETKSYKEFNFGVVSNTIEFEGNYFNLLNILHDIEYKKGLGRINSCSFYIIEDVFKKNKKLRMKLTIHNISDQ